jgi:hypothetical protein
MLQRIEREIGLPGRIRVAVNRDYAALLAELGIVAVPWRRKMLKCRSFASLRMTSNLGAMKRLGNIGDPGHSLKQHAGHARTSL